MTNLKKNNCDNSKNQIVTKLKYSNSDQTQKIKLLGGKNYKKLNCDSGNSDSSDSSSSDSSNSDIF